MSIKNIVLAKLLDTGTVSGNQLAADLGVSRNAIWKAIKQLQDEGCTIEAATNRGYRLLSVGNTISEPVIRKYLKSAVPYSFAIFEMLDSTNIKAKELAISGTPHGTVVIADTQANGRGRLSRSFFSPPQRSVYMTLVLRPDIAASKAPLITTYTAVAVSRAIESLCAANVQIKWVNDLFLNGKKICGILSEAGFDFESGGIDYVAIGIGVNVLGLDFPEALSQIATSIEKEYAVKLSRNALIAAILDEMEGMEKNLKSGEYLEEYRRRSIILGKEINVLYGKEEFRAIAEEIDDNGALIVSTENGKKTINAGEVSIRL